MTEPVQLNPAPPAVPVTHLDALPAGTRLGEFEIAGLLGVGGFGMVYQAFDHSLQRDVAIKEYMPASLARRSQGSAVSVRSSADVQTFNGGLKSFISEARLLAQFDHPSLVKVFRFWEENNTAYMVMPLYRGITLKQARTQMRCPPPEEWLRKVLWSVLGALKILHSGNTMHRDISPENIFLQDIGPPVLLDLGAARRAIHETNQQLTATLKFSYAPIEQYGDAADLRQGPWTDLYALASVVHGCMANELPLPATLRVIRDRMPSLASIAKRAHDEFGLSYSPEFVLTIDQALAVRPAGRPKSANTFARLMDLRVPSGMSKFDWRAELGDIYVPPVRSESSGAMAQATTVAIQPRSSIYTRTQPSVATQAQPRFAAPLFGGVASRIKPHWWVLVAVSVAALSLAGVGLWNSRTPPNAGQVPVVTGRSAEVPSSLAASTPVVMVADSAASAAPAAPSPISEVSKTQAVTQAAPSADSAAASVRKAKRAKPTLENKPVLGSAAPVLAPAPVLPPVRADSASDTARKAAAIPAPAPKVSARTPETVCADASFFARPMCVHEQCQKPEFVNLPMCVERARRLREPRTLSN